MVSPITEIQWFQDISLLFLGAFLGVTGIRKFEVILVCILGALWVVVHWKKSMEKDGFEKQSSVVHWKKKIGERWIEMRVTGV